MEKRKDNYKLKKTLYSFGIASVLLMTGCNSRYDSQESSISQSSISQSSIETNDAIEKQEVKISISENNEEELICSLRKLENDLPTIIIDNKVTGLEISVPINRTNLSTKLSSESIELIKTIATSCPDLTSLSISNLYIEDEDLTWISTLTNLTNLDLSYNYLGLTDISFVETLQNLETLDIEFTRVEDISCLTNLTNLKSLDMSSTLINDCSVIADLPNLASLDIIGCNNLNYNYISYNFGQYNSREEIEELIAIMKEDEKGYILIPN